jgi:D-sedoheptulose 7-phosphate isomerase
MESQNRDEKRSQQVAQHLMESASVKRQMVEECMEDILQAADALSASFRSGGKLLLCGNGGSAADCQHMAAEFVSRLTKDFERTALPAIALTTDSSFLTAFTNDCGFERVFERQVLALGKRGDVLIGISTSGSSPNILRAMTTAKSIGMFTILLAGNGVKRRAHVDTTIAIPSANTQLTQEAHIAVEHILCELVEYDLFKSKGRTTL